MSYLTDEKGKLLKYFGNYKGETYEGGNNKFSPFIGSPHGKGKVCLEDKRGFFLLEGKFEYGNPVEGTMETNIIDECLISFGIDFRQFNELCKNKFSYQKPIDYSDAKPYTPTQIEIDNENKRIDRYKKDLTKQVNTKFKFKGKWKKKSIQIIMQAPQTIMSVNLPEYLPRTHLTEFLKGEVHDFFGNYYSGSFKSDQTWRPEGHGVMKLANNYELNGNFITKSPQTYFHGKMIMPNGKKIDIEDARPVTEQISDEFLHWIDKI
jgi:hypothetical protein